MTEPPSGSPWDPERGPRDGHAPGPHELSPHTPEGPRSPAPHGRAPDPRSTSRDPHAQAPTDPHDPHGARERPTSAPGDTTDAGRTPEREEPADTEGED
ncbi:hypothetical protein [Streptomyces sp. NPDC007904]|uniref:hypothetical protein n=1 Tax=Streptomyces sp. NPDC007904 TaxID=3364787 RepID=UPI0036EFD035